MNLNPDNMTQKKRNRLWNIIGIISLVVLVALLMKSYHTNRMEDVMHRAIQDTLRTYKDINGNQRAIIGTIQASNSRMIMDINSRDTTIQRLQKAILKYEKEGFTGKPGSSISIIGTNTGVTTTNPTTIDSVPMFTGEFPVYRSIFNMERWVKGSTVATKDSTTVRIDVRNEFDLIIDYEKTGFLGMGRPKPVSQFVSMNPYTTVNEFRTFQVADPPPINLVIGPSVGYGFGGVILGVTATYPLIKLRL